MTARPDDAHRPDSDPTHALDGFLQRMQPSPRPGKGDDGDPTDLSGLTARLQAGGAGSRTATPPPTASRPRGGTLRNGERWRADDVTDVPVVELPRVQPATTHSVQDDAELHGIVQQARSAAATAAEVTARATADWHPDPHTLQLRRAADPRLLSRWQAGAWIGAQRTVLQASTEFFSAPGSGTAAAPVVESHDAQRLLVLWAPPSAQAPHPGRWPLLVLLMPLPAEAAADALLAARPAEAASAPIWLDPDPAHVDWALAAEIALHHVPGLRPFQVDGLRAFIEAERQMSFGRLNDGYAAVRGGATAKAAAGEAQR